MNATEQQQRCIPGLRMAAVVYLIIVIAGLAGTGAHALWSQTGTVTAGVTAGTWAPKPVNSGSITCTRENAPNNQLDVTLDWDPTDATSYTVAATGPSTPQPVSTTAAPATLRLERPDWFGTKTYQVTITPEAAGAKAAPTRIQVDLIRSVLSPQIRCTPLG